MTRYVVSFTISFSGSCGRSSLDKTFSRRSSRKFPLARVCEQERSVPVVAVSLKFLRGYARQRKKLARCDASSNAFNSIEHVRITEAYI